MIRILLAALATFGFFGMSMEGRAQSIGGWTSDTVQCASINKRRATCNTPFRGRPILVQNLSSTRCLEGVNFGGGNGTMWVDGGCRGRFTEGRGQGGNWRDPSFGAASVVRCESINNRTRVCDTNFRGQARLIRQISGTPCIENDTWGQRRGSVWVTRGCRAEFIDEGGGHRPGRR